MRRSTFAAFILAALLAGCAVKTLTAPTAPAAAPALAMALAPATLSPLAPEEGAGGVRLSVRWPRYEAQQLPFSTVAIDFALRDAQSVAVATASIVRPASEALLMRIPSGAYTLSAEARAADRTVTARASAALQVVPNRLTAVPLTLEILNVPTVTGLSRSIVRAGGSFWVFGAHLSPPAGGTYSVMVDGQALPAASLQPGAAAIAVTRAPQWLTANSHVSVSVDGVLALGSPALALRAIDHVSITPAIATMSAGSSQTFQWHAFLDAAGTQETADDLQFAASLTAVSPSLNPSTGMPPFVLNGTSVSTSATGSFTLLVTEEGKSATLDVTVVAPAPSATPFDPYAPPGGGPGPGAPPGGDPGGLP